MAKSFCQRLIEFLLSVSELLIGIGWHWHWRAYLKTGMSFLRMPRMQEMKMWATTESQTGRTLSGTSDSMLSHT